MSNYDTRVDPRLPVALALTPSCTLDDQGLKRSNKPGLRSLRTARTLEEGMVRFCSLSSFLTRTRLAAVGFEMLPVQSTAMCDGSRHLNRGRLSLAVGSTGWWEVSRRRTSAIVFLRWEAH